MPVSNPTIPHVEEVSERAHENLALLYGGESRRSGPIFGPGRAVGAVCATMADASAEPARIARLS